MSIWVESVRRGLDEALELLAAVVQGCPDELWRSPMWQVSTSDIVGDLRDVDGRAVYDPAQRDALVQRWSAPWSVAWHALEVFDYDLVGELDAWVPPAPFAGKPHWRTFTSLPVPWSQSQIGGYIDFCRQRVCDVMDAMTEIRAATLLPSAHRYAGSPYAWIVTSLIAHTSAHATQIRQFRTAFDTANT